LFIGFYRSLRDIRLRHGRCELLRSHEELFDTSGEAFSVHRMAVLTAIYNKFSAQAQGLGGHSRAQKSMSSAVFDISLCCSCGLTSQPRTGRSAIKINLVVFVLPNGTPRV
jgi:hypothetical protein